MTMRNPLPIEKVQLRVTPRLDPLLSTLQHNLRDDLMRYLLTARSENKAATTVDLYAMVVSRYLRFLETVEPSPDNVRLFLLSLQDGGMSPNSVHIYYRSLKTWFNWLCQEGRMRTSPMKNVKGPELPRTLIKPFTDDETTNLLRECGKSSYPLRDTAMLLVFLDAGPRRKEVANMMLPDLNFDNCTIKVNGKGAKERLVPFGQHTRQALVRYVTKRTDTHDALWVTVTGAPLSSDGVKTLIRRLTARAIHRTKKRGAHTFRHTAAMSYLLNGGDPFTLQTMLGHSSPTMTRRYTESLKQKHLLKVHKIASPVDNLLGNTKRRP